MLRVRVICVGIIIILGYFFTRRIFLNTYDELYSRLQGPFKAEDGEMIEILKNKFIEQPSTKTYNLSSNHAYKMTKNSFSWPFIHHYVENIFSNYTDGFFVEAGALDGEYLSNTLWLEKERNWTGLLIEPDQNNYKELLLKNRKSWTSNTCISTELYPKTTIFLSRRRKVDIISINNWVYRGATHEIGYSKERSIDSFLKTSTSTYYSVQCFPLVSYLLALNRTKIDFLSLDIQGSEMDVMKTFPFDQIDVRVIVIEHIEPFYYDKNFVQFFKEKGFDVIGCAGEPDYIFIKRNQIQNYNINFIKIFKCRLK